MATTNQSYIRNALRQGGIASLVTLSVSIIGMVELFGLRDLVANLFTMGQVLVYAAPVVIAYITSRPLADNRTQALFNGIIIGFVSAIPLIILVWLPEMFNLRRYLINVTPTLIELITFGQGLAVGSLIILASMVAIGLIGAWLVMLPPLVTGPLFSGVSGTLLVGLFSEIISERVRNFFGSSFNSLIFQSKALRLIPAIVVFLVFAGLSIWRSKREESKKIQKSPFSLTKNGKLNWVNIGIVLVFILILPQILGTYLSEVFNNIGLYVLMGLGLNIVVGFAGLLDLGYVAFFAIGAYTMAILTSEGHLGISGLSFWAALPICVLVAALSGILLGMPVLRMRGDYLAIVTLGFGEIIRILALSDLLKPFIGGAQGVLKIPKPSIGGVELIKPQYLYYVVLAGVLLAVFVSWRLRDSRLGRQWMALREDEDVAEAMGINLVNTKLLAFAVGAAFSGLSGGIFASKLTSIFPHSFNLLISINVLCLIIVGGIGSFPGVAVGALILVGLPELLREFAEFRMLMYGALLIVMMLARPEGFLPAEVFKREFHAGDEEE